MFNRRSSEVTGLNRREDHRWVDAGHKLSFLLEHARANSDPFANAHFHTISGTFGVIADQEEERRTSAPTPPLLKVIRRQRKRYEFKLMVLALLIVVIGAFTACDHRPQSSFRRGVKVLASYF